MSDLIDRMTVRTEQTLRRMWDESLKLASEAAQFTADARECATAQQAHERAAAAEAAAAASAKEAARAKHTVAKGKEAEAADLADMVNEKRQAAGLFLLAPGDPYPAEQDPAVTRTDGEVAQP